MLSNEKLRVTFRCKYTKLSARLARSHSFHSCFSEFPACRYRHYKYYNKNQPTQGYIVPSFYPGGGGALDPHFGRYVPRRSEKRRALERLEHRNDSLWSGRERENIGSLARAVA